jgi:hypothetical protein
LQNVVERTVIFCETDTFVVDERWLKLESGKLETPHQGLSALADREVEIIEAALARFLLTLYRWIGMIPIERR